MNNLNNKLVTPIDDKEFLKRFNKNKVNQRYLETCRKVGIFFKERKKKDGSLG